VDRTFWEVLDVDHGKLLRNAVLWATNEPAPVSVKGAGVLDLSIWTQKNSMTVHLVNLTNPMAMKGLYRTFYPSGPYTVRIRVPEKPRGTKAKLLAAGTAVSMERSGGDLTITVPSLLDHEVIAIDI